MAPNRIKELRKARGLTLEDLAAEVRLSVPYVQRLENGTRNLAVKHFDKFAKALKVSARELVVDGAPTPAVKASGPVPRAKLKLVDAPKPMPRLTDPAPRPDATNGTAAAPGTFGEVIERQHPRSKAAFSMGTHGDGHRIRDISTATGELKAFLDAHMRPKCQLWQIDSDAIDLHFPEGSYVVIDPAAPVELRALVLAELDTPDGPTAIFGSVTARRLVFRSTAVKEPNFIERTAALRIIGPIVAAWPQPE